MSCYVMLCCVMLCCVMSVMFCYVMLQVMLCYITGYVMLYYWLRYVLIRLTLQVRLLERVIRDGKRVGLHLEKEKQDRIKEIDSKMSSLGRSLFLCSSSGSGMEV